MQQLRDATQGGLQELKLAIVRPLASYVHHELGHAQLVDLATLCQLDPDDLLFGKGWASQDQVEQFASQVLQILKNDESVFVEAASFRVDLAYGPLRYLLWAASPGIVLKQAMLHLNLVSSFGEYQINDDGHVFLDASYRSDRSEARVLCLLRQANARVLPTLWGLPLAQLEELSCISRGDECCRYRARWNASWRWGPLVLGSSLGVFVAIVAGWPTWAPAALLLGGALGYLGEQRRSNRINMRFAEEARLAVEELAHEEAQARQELAGLHSREKSWSAMLEQRLADQDAVMQDSVRELQNMQSERIDQIREFSHDLKNPLSFLSAAVDMMEECPDLVDGEIRWVIHHQRTGIEKMDRMIQQILGVFRSQSKAVPLRLTSMDLQPRIEGLRRRVQALVRGRDIRVSVLHTRDMPARIQTDLMVFERIVDNILTNAAKYTQQGSILIELGGSPGFLVIKVLDTGQGISEEKIERIFEPEGTAGDERTEGSWGVGLSVVVSLLDQLGGRLEVLSKPAVGTTFWIYVPTSPEIESSQVVESGQHEMPDPPAQMANDKLARIVHIRRIG